MNRYISENPTMRWHRGLKHSNKVEHPPMSLGRRVFRYNLKKRIKEKRRVDYKEIK